MGEKTKIRSSKPIHNVGDRLKVTNGYLLVCSRKIKPFFTDYEVEFFADPVPGQDRLSLWQKIGKVFGVVPNPERN